MTELKILLCATAENPWLKKDTEQTQRLERCFEGFKYIYRDQGLVSLKEAENLKWLHIPSVDLRGYDKAALYVNDFAILTHGEAFAHPDDAMETILVLMKQYLDGDDLDNEVEKV